MTYTVHSIDSAPATAKDILAGAKKSLGLYRISSVSWRKRRPS